MDQTDELIKYLEEDIELDLQAYLKCKTEGNDHQFYLSSSALKKQFEIALMHWRRGDFKSSLARLCGCVETYNQMIRDADAYAALTGFWENFWEGNCRDEAFPAAASYLSGFEFIFAETPAGISRFEEEGYRPWYNSKIILACVGHASISKEELDRSLSLSKQNRSYPAQLVKLTEFHLEVLTGQWADRPALEILEAHSRLYGELGKIKGAPDLIHGEGQHNDRVVDWIFACILKRIGWVGQYRHAWPQDNQSVGFHDLIYTEVEPTSYLILTQRAE